MKKFLAYPLAIALTISCFPINGSNSRVDALASDVNVTINDNEVAIGNDYIGRNFSINNGKISTSSIINKKINQSLIPQSGSQDFIINTLQKENIGDDDLIVNNPVYTYTEALPTVGWNATLKNSEGTEFEKSEVEKLFDDDLNTNVDDYTIAGNPFTLDIDFGEVKTIAGMSVNKRPGFTHQSYGINGTMGSYEIWTSENGNDYIKLMEGEFTEEDYNLHKVGDLFNVGDMVYVNFDAPVDTQYVRVVQTGVALGSAQEFSSAEIDFYNQEIIKTQKVVEPKQVIDRDNWDVSIQNKSGTAFDETNTSYLIDGDLNTFPDNYLISGNPFYVDIDLGSEQVVSSLSIDKRPGYTHESYGINGTMGEFELYVSKDGNSWRLAGAGNFTSDAYGLHQEGDLYNVGNRVYANFYKPYTTRYVRLVQKSCSLGRAEEFSSSELNLYADAYQGPNWNMEIDPVSEDAILSSDLTFDDATVEDMENGKKLTINYEPYLFNNVTYDIAQVLVLNSNEEYMRSFLEISVDDKDKAQIDYIDTDRFVLPEDAQGVWTRPEDSEISSLGLRPSELMLGQPIYVNGMFMGSEFPSADTYIENNQTQIRYYSGKTFSKLKEDGQLTTDDKFVSWQNVIGAADGIDTAVVQTSFFEYIEDIATPTEFRKQYNSWYDNMMNITDESIEKSFSGAEKGLTQNGVEPLDSYVVDDGWNNYYDGKYVSTPGTDRGTTPNQTGFWEFNSKFPNELYTSSALSDKFNSTFGVWIGPLGGYNYFSGFGQFLESKGTGFSQANSSLANSICVGSRKYVKNFQAMAIDYQNRFNVEYWKWDGFASRPCNDSSHDHMTGGDHDMYFTTDLWEAWIDLFENVRENNPNIFINATCAVNLSPWLLQWVNTVWVQDSGDTGQLGTGERHEQKIYYRDQVYYKLYKQNQIQFPLKNIYNHDPIYGVSDGSNATTEVFREYLFANAVRGTGFWELYYSPSIMDDAKWKVTADVLNWAEENHEVLKNAKIFGNQPQNGVYGYSSWNGNEGIVSFTNPLDSEQTYSLTVDEIVGAPKTINDLTGIQVEPYATGTLENKLSYGDTLTVTLNPHETIIYHFGKIDEIAPSIVSAKVTNSDEVTLKFNERIQNGEFYLNNKEVSAELKEDYRTVVLKADTVFENQVEVNIKNIEDFNGNTFSDNLNIPYYEEDVIASVKNSTSLINSKDIEVSYDSVADALWLNGINEEYKINTENKLIGDDDFTISTGVKTNSKGVNLFKSSDEVSLSIDDEGYVEFTVKDVTLTSKEEVITVIEKAHGTFGTDEYVPTTYKTDVIGKVNDGKEHSIDAVREINGMLKLYVDGRLVNSFYDENTLNENLSGGELFIGDNEYEGQLASLQVLNRALGYDEVHAFDTTISEEIPSNREGWTVTSCSEDASNLGTYAIDGNTSTFWHTDWHGGDTCEDPHWIAINFNREEEFDRFFYSTRGIQENGSIKDYKLEIKDKDGNYTVIKEGSFSSESSSNTIKLDKKYSAYGIRLTAMSTHNGNDYAAAIEINIAKPDVAIPNEQLEQKVNEVLANIGEINYDNYTRKSGNELKEIIFKLENLINASEESFKTLTKELNGAKESLVNIVTLKEVINNANEILENGKEYTEETYNAFINALNTATKAIELAETQEEVDNTTKALQEAMDTLVEIEVDTDKTALKIAVDLANAITDEDLTNVVQAVVDEFKVARDEANAVYNDASATQDEINNAFDRLASAMQMLDFVKGDKTALKAFIDKVSGLDSTKYSTDTWVAFEKELNEANVVYNDENAMQEEVNSVYKELVTAFLNLRLIPDKSLLEELINKAEGLDSANYTKATFDGLTKALNEAKVVFESPNATQTEVDNAKDVLAKAIEGLQANPSTPSNVDNTVKTPVNNGDTTSVKTGDESLAGMFATIALLSIAGYTVFRKKEND